MFLGRTCFVIPAKAGIRYAGRGRSPTWVAVAAGADRHARLAPVRATAIWILPPYTLTGTARLREYRIPDTGPTMAPNYRMPLLPILVRRAARPPGWSSGKAGLQRK